MAPFPSRVPLGRTGLAVSKLGFGSSFLAPSAAYLESFDRGVNYFYWGSLRRSMMRDAIHEIARGPRRDELVVVVQSYARVAALLERSVNHALRALGLDRAQVLLLGWHNRRPSRRIVETALELRERGRVAAIALSGHHRPLFPDLLEDRTYDIWHVRYNAVHRGAEREVFPALTGRAPSERPGLVTYTTTRWGHLCDPARTPAGERTPTGTDCYRFALTSPEVDLCLAGPADLDQARQAVDALELGPMDEAELAWMRRVGDHIYGKDRTSTLRDGV